MSKVEFTQELKDKWLEALRSGEYEQTTGTLHDATGFCCLGVLCDVIDPDGWATDITEDEKSDSSFDDSWLHSHGAFVYGRSFAGANRDSNYPVHDSIYDILPVKYSEFVTRNDGDFIEIDEESGDENHRLFDFHDMADWIEENVPADG